MLLQMWSLLNTGVPMAWASCMLGLHQHTDQSKVNIDPTLNRCHVAQNPNNTGRTMKHTNYSQHRAGARFEPCRFDATELPTNMPHTSRKFYLKLFSLILAEAEVCSAFIRVSRGKAPGSDSIHDQVLREYTVQLVEVFTDIFSKNWLVIPTCFF